MAASREIINIGLDFGLHKRFPELEPAELVRQFLKGEEAKRKGVGYGITAITTDSRGTDWYLGDRKSIPSDSGTIGLRMIECSMTRLDEQRRETNLRKTLRIHYRGVRAHFENGFIPEAQFED